MGNVPPSRVNCGTGSERGISRKVLWRTAQVLARKGKREGNLLYKEGNKWAVIRRDQEAKGSEGWPKGRLHAELLCSPALNGWWKAPRSADCRKQRWGYAATEVNNLPFCIFS